MNESAGPKQALHLWATLLGLFALGLSLFTLGSLNKAGLFAAALSTASATYLVTLSSAGAARNALAIAVAALILLVVVETIVLWQVAAVSERWPEHGELRQSETYAELGAELNEAVQHAALVARRAAGAATLTKDTIALFNSLTSLFAGSRVDAIALFGPLGELTAWAGEHKAPIPERVRLSGVSALFVEQPLYSYFYRTYPLPDGQGYAAAAVLLSRTVHGSSHEPSHSGIAELIAHAGGTVSPPAGRTGALPLVIAGDTIAHLTIPVMSEQEVQSRYLAPARSVALVLGLSVFASLFVAMRGVSASRRQKTVLLALAPLALIWTPWPWKDAAVLYIAPSRIPLGNHISIPMLLAVLTSAGFLLASLPYRATTKTKRFLFTFGIAFLVSLVYAVFLSWFLGPR